MLAHTHVHLFYTISCSCGPCPLPMLGLLQRQGVPLLLPHVPALEYWAAIQGYAFCELADVNNTEYIIQNLNGKQVGNKFLTVKRALQPSTTF